MRILVLANVFPLPPHGGTELRILNILKRVARKHEVTLCAHTRSKVPASSIEELSRIGIRTFTGPVDGQPDFGKALKAVGLALSGKPPELALYRSGELALKVAALVQKERFDILQIEETLMTPYADLAPREVIRRRLLVLHNIHFVQTRRAAAIDAKRSMRIWRWINASFMRSFEPATAGHFDRTICMSAYDRQLLLRARPGLNVDILPNGVDTAALRPLSPPVGEPSILFVGAMHYAPCEDGAEWLVRRILPLIRREVSNVELWIVGKEPGPRVQRLREERISITGEVAELQPYYARASVAVAPLRAGSGTRLKILEAMALGRPVVSTSIGVEGLDVVGEKHLLIADTENQFADAVVRLLRDPELAASLSSEARKLVVASYDWDAIAARQLEIYSEMTA